MTHDLHDVLYNKCDCRLDAGTFGTMGVGCGFAIAAALVEQQKPLSQRSPVVCVQGDSAFGFSGMEVETAHRFVLNICTA